MRSSATITATVAILTALLIPMSTFGAPRGKELPNPDFTRGGVKGDSHDWTLGPTGARGWIYGRKGHTADARQILITAVADGSPADGILESGDVILGVGGKRFSGDARIQFANAITAAEQESSAGALRLTRWRKGKTDTVELELPVMGTYSDTAPYECPKSKKIFDLGCRAIAKRGLDRISIPNNLNALALLASGKKEYRPMLAAYARQVAAFKVESFASWHYGFAALFLAEYAAATRDPAVMPGLRRISNEIAKGASAVGSWGHRFARPSGVCNGYGAMNLPGLVLVQALVTAREAGVADPDVDRTIAKAARFLRWYVNKGAIPYGDHGPWPGHEDNGKCSSAAMLFDLLGDREAATFFAKMSTAAYDERERGHTGNFFNMLWALPGVSRCGPLATGAYMKEHAWYYDLARGQAGVFRYQGSPVGEEEHRKYTHWDSTGAYLLTYALPLKSLYLTGKKPCVVSPLNAKQVSDVIDAGRDYFSARKGQGYQGRTVEQLLTGLSSWSPAVRKRSAQALGKREGDFVPTLLKLLAGSDRDARYGACEALGNLGPRADAAAPQLRALLKNRDPWLQCLACDSLSKLSPEVRTASTNDIVSMLSRPNPADPRGIAHRYATQALFGRGGMLSGSADDVDRRLFYPAVQLALQNEDGRARGFVGSVYGKLTDRDLAVLLPTIFKATRDLAPSGIMFADGIRMSGLDLLTRLHIREGMDVCVAIIEPDRWGAGRRLPKGLECLSRYGVHAKAVLPQLQELRQQLIKRDRRREQSDAVKRLDKCIAEIKASTASPTVLTLKEFMARSSSVRKGK